MAAPSASQLLRDIGGDVLALPLAGDLPQIGSIAGLPAWAAMANAADVQRIARRFARHGDLGLVLASDVPAERWILAVTMLPVRVVHVAWSDTDALVFRRMRKAARVARETPLEQAIAFTEALDVDAAGRRTFKLLHRLLDRAVESLPSRIGRDDRHAWALAQVTRLLFLRFVESEGWLDGNPRFLAEAFDRCLVARRDPTRHLLHPLFFGTLNREWGERSRFARAFGAIPFLNGGLFEPHPVERLHRLRLPAEYWREAFASMVDRVEVSLDARLDDGRVTPELLGRVFEGVMHAAERKEHGAFFTPPALVDAMLRGSLACHLAPKLRRSEDAIERALDDPDAELRRIMMDVTVLDPAVGSGAFLVGALQLLHGPGDRSAARVRHLVTRRLFGVDRHPGAVRLCELRLWLEVLRAMRGRVPSRVPPLPNLDACVRAGDALIDPLHGTSLDAAAARAIRVRQQLIRGAHGGAKRALIADARRSERNAMLRTLRLREEVLERQIAELIAAARAPTLFGGRAAADPARRRAIDAYRQQRATTREERRRLLRDAAASPFAIGTAFAPVMHRRGGFDLVVGNPPWVRAEQLPSGTRDALAERYRWWRGSGPGWHHLPDLSVAFVERGFTLLGPGGTFAFLVPAKLATAAYASTCRSELLTRATIHRVADLGRDPRAGFEATTYPLAIVASRRPPPSGHTVRLGLRSDDPAQPQNAWRESSAWLTASPAAQRVAARIDHEHPRLAEFITPQLGVKTGANTAFLDPPVALQEWTRPAVRGRDIRPFSATPSATLLWPADHRGVPWRELPPPLAEHFARELPRLERRADHHVGPCWQLFRTWAATAPHRVVWRDLSTELQAAVLDDGDAVPLNSCYVAAMPSAGAAESFAAWLNATPLRALARMRAEPAAGGCARFAARTVAALPLPREVLGHPVLASLAHVARDRDVQTALDDCVVEILGLSPAESDVLRDVATHRR